MNAPATRHLGLALLTAVVVLFSTMPPSSAAAQDSFGRSVEVVGGALFVSKPIVGVGSATVYVFERDESGWRVSQRLRAAGGSTRGEGFSASMAWSGSELVVASGDPELHWAAHTFAQGTGTDWSSSEMVPLDPSLTTVSTAGPPEVTMATVMGILEPPQRVVAASPGRIAVAVAGSSAPTPPPVRVLRRLADGSWDSEAELLPEAITNGARFGSALALASDRLAVGAPGADGHGAVWIYQKNAQGAWSLETVLGAGAPSPGAGFGTAVTFADARLLVGAPGTPSEPGAVFVFEVSPSGNWTEQGRVTTPDPEPGDRLGEVIATWDDEVWAGAPGANNGRGAVVRFTPQGAETSQAVAPISTWLPTPDLEPGFRFGTALAVGPQTAVVGAHNAKGGPGAAFAYDRSVSGWSEPIALSSDEELGAVTGGQVDCSADGEAAGFDCDEVDLLSFLPLSALGAEPGERVSDIWGWTDPETRREYILAGRTAGMAIVDVTDAANPRYLGLVPANPSHARDIKVYQDYAFFTGDGAGQHGMVVFDLRHVRDLTSVPTQFQPDARYEGIASAHNLVLDPEAGFAYPVGASGGGETCGGGLHMVDVRDPLNPTFAGCFTDTEGLIWEGRTHDAQCTVYRGPDDRYRGREVCFVSNETALRIVDVTDKENPVPLGSASYPGVAYIHQGWLTEDQRYFYLNDELDELVGTTERTRTLIWDVSELDDPVLASDYFGPNGATDHNLYVKGDRMYQANYQAGFRVLDISDPEAPVEVGYFDTTPYDGDPPGFVGAWTAFPYFESGTVVVSSMYEGLFLLKPRRRDLIP
ncbi:MAG: choice-of-anchor B domain-containing protein [Myxococcota bacterium]|jgi:choice-of-anchor B domain-containing protein